MDVDDQDTLDVEMGMKPIDEKDNEHTLGTFSRHIIQVVKHSDRNRTLEHCREYMQSDELLKELGYGPNSSGLFHFLFLFFSLHLSSSEVNCANMLTTCQIAVFLLIITDLEVLFLMYLHLNRGLTLGK